MNGLQVNNLIPIRATVTIDSSLIFSGTATNATLIEERVKNDLAFRMATQLQQFMTIHKHEDLKTFRHIYEGTVYMAVTRQPLNHTTPLPNISTSPFNGTSIANAYTIANSGQISTSSTSHVKEYDKMRVCEYIKDGKITRVELQRYEDGFWTKIPRVQIEE